MSRFLYYSGCIFPDEQFRILPGQTRTSLLRRGRREPLLVRKDGMHTSLFKMKMGSAAEYLQ